MRPTTQLSSGPGISVLERAPTSRSSSEEATGSGRPRVRHRFPGSARIWSGSLLLLVVALWVLLQRQYPYLGHDEAVYASQARHWVDGLPAVSWRSYRPIGLPGLGTAMLWITPDVVPDALALRSITLLAAVGYVLATAVLARRWLDPHRVVLTMAVLITGVTFLRRLPEFLNDLGSAALMLAVVSQILRARSRPDRVGPAMTGAAAFAVAACLLRYGATSGLLAIVLAAVITWGFASWWRDRRQLLGAVLVTGVAAVLAGVMGLRATGTPWGLLLSAGKVAHRTFVGDGIVFYLKAFPLELAGPLGFLVMSAGLIGAASLWWRRHRADPVDEVIPARVVSERVFLALTAVLHLLILGVVAHGEQRFALFPIAVLTVLGVDALDRMPQPWRTRALTGVIAAVLPALLLSLVVVWRGGQVVTEARQPLVEGVRMVSVDGPCLVVTPLVPETGWATRCRVIAPKDLDAVPPGTTVVVLHREGRSADPDPRELAGNLPGRRWTTKRVVTGPDGLAVLISRFPATAPS